MHAGEDKRNSYEDRDWPKDIFFSTTGCLSLMIMSDWHHKPYSLDWEWLDGDLYFLSFSFCFLCLWFWGVRSPFQMCGGNENTRGKGFSSRVCLDCVNHERGSKRKINKINLNLKIKNQFFLPSFLSKNLSKKATQKYILELLPSHVSLLFILVFTWRKKEREIVGRCPIKSHKWEHGKIRVLLEVLLENISRIFNTWIM